MNKMMSLVMVSELIVKQLEDIKENRTQAESVALIPYIHQLQDVNNELLAELYLESTLFEFMVLPLKKIARDINRPVKDGIEAQTRLQNIYNLLRPFVDYVETNMGVHDEALEQKQIDEVTPKDICEDLEKLNRNLKSFMELRPNMMVATDRDEAIKMAEEMIHKMEKTGAPKEKIQHMKDVLEKAIKE
jgi:hypothetical protein